MHTHKFTKHGMVKRKRRLKKLYDSLNNVQEGNNLSESEDHYDNKCGICLERIKEKAKP